MLCCHRGNTAFNFVITDYLIMIAAASIRSEPATHATHWPEISMKFSVLIVVACASSLTWLAMTQIVLAADDQRALGYVVELQVPGAQRKMLEENLDLYRWRGNARMNEAQLQRLVQQAPEQIRKFLATDGFYSPMIESRMKHDGSRWIVNLIVDPRKPVHVSSFDLQVTGAFNDGSPGSLARLKKMRSDWRLRPGMTFRHNDWESAKRNALKALLLDGYPAASIVDSHATVNQERLSADLRVTLDSGPIFTFGTLEIKGLHRYPTSLVERMNPIAPGETYSQAKLLEFYSRLQDTPYFSNASISVDVDSKQTNNVPILVEVIENQSQKLGFGIGMSTDTGARGLVDYRDLNFLDRALWLGVALKLEQKRQSLVGNLQLPLTEQGFRDSINTLIERTNIEGVEDQKLGVGIKRTFIRENIETAYGLRYLLENQYIAAVESMRNTALGPFYSWTLRNVDSVLYPTRGYVVNLQADTATRAILSDQDFLRGYSRVVFYYPFGKSDQLALRGELGMVAARSRKGIPSDYLFRTGGDQTVRGYAYQSLGALEGGAVVASRNLAIASAEYVHWFIPQWGGAIFLDGGNAADTWGDLIPVYGYGAGARWKSPVGPLNLDIAYGRETREMRIHFSVGFHF